MFSKMLCLSSLLSASMFSSAQETNTDIIVSAKNSIYRYTLAGDLLDTQPIDESNYHYPARDLIALDNGEIAVYNGVFSPLLSILSDQNWTHQNIEGWSTINNTTYGGITSLNNFIYVTDMRTAGTGAPRGILKIDQIEGTAERFFENTDFIDVSLGADNLLHAVVSDYREIITIDPASMTALDNSRLPGLLTARAITADTDGNLYLASYLDGFYKINSRGEVVGTIFLDYELRDVDIKGDLLLVAGRDEFFLLNTSLEIIRRYSNPEDYAFIAFAPPKDTTPGEPGHLSRQPHFNARYLDSDMNGVFETRDEAPSSLSVRKFSIFEEVSVSCYDLAYPDELTSASLTIDIRGYTTTTEGVNIYAFNGATASDLATQDALRVADYRPVQLDLGLQTLQLNTGTLAGVLRENGGVCLRFEGVNNGANTQLGTNSELHLDYQGPISTPEPTPTSTPSVEPSTEPSVTPTPPTYARHYTANQSSILLDNDQDGYFESITSQPYSLSIRKFAAIDEVSVICYDASYPGEIVGSELTISIQGYTSSTTQVNIFAIPGENPITPDMATLPGELLGTYYPAQLQLGEHHVELDSSNINAELFTEAGICLRIEGDIIPTNTQLSPNAQLTIWLDSPPVPPVPNPIPSITPTPTPVPTITPLPSLEPTPAASQTLSCRHIISSEWESGFAADIEIRNITDVPVSGWNIIWTYDNGEDVTQSWNANVTGDNPFSATNLSWNSVIPPGGMVKFGFIGSKTGEVSQPTWGGDCSQSL